MSMFMIAGVDKSVETFVSVSPSFRNFLPSQWGQHYVPRYLCSPVPMFPEPMFPGTDVPRYLCSPVPMFHKTYVPRYRCSPNLCSPVPMFPDLLQMCWISRVWGGACVCACVRERVRVHVCALGEGLAYVQVCVRACGCACGRAYIQTVPASDAQTS